ncbi:MAG TPA: A24 family peptidase [Verrucomicrobiae bacterium]|jgi:leader peptidase (prepilin peptidase)/N-methyltransferase|nr:A24 family peptidase [Verrucomicrobiae bacterium]
MILVHFATLLLAALLALVTIIDLRTMRIPDVLNAALVVSGLVVNWILHRAIVDALIGAVAGYAAIYVLNMVYRALRGGDGMGMGDAKLLAGGGAWLGWIGLPFVALLGSAAGIIFVSVQRIRGRTLQAQDALAFGPFLCVGIFIVWLVQVYS